MVSPRSESIRGSPPRAFICRLSVFSDSSVGISFSIIGRIALLRQFKEAMIPAEDDVRK